jgi:transcriptional regulator with XRE-family HTH domain
MSSDSIGQTERAADNSVLINGSMVRTLRQQKGWPISDLAHKAQCSARTIQAVERGVKPVYRVTLSKIAKALNVEQSTLINGEAHEVQADPPPQTPSSFAFHVHVNINFDDFDETSDLGIWLKQLAAVIAMKGDVNADDVQRRSLMIDLSFTSEEDAKALIEAFIAKRLRVLGVTSVAVRFDNPLYAYLENLAQKDSSQTTVIQPPAAGLDYSCEQIQEFLDKAFGPDEDPKATSPVIEPTGNSKNNNN